MCRLLLRFGIAGFFPFCFLLILPPQNQAPTTSNESRKVTYPPSLFFGVILTALINDLTCSKKGSYYLAGLMGLTPPSPTSEVALCPLFIPFLVLVILLTGLEVFRKTAFPTLFLTAPLPVAGNAS